MSASSGEGRSPPAETWGTAADNAGPAVSIFADRAHVRAEMVEDVRAAGSRVAAASELGGIFADHADGDGIAPTGEAKAALPSARDADIGEIALFDCPVCDDAALALLARLDGRVARHGAQLIVSTSMTSLDAVFRCLDRSESVILVAPSRAERVIALGEALADTGNQVRELSSDDRFALLRLTEQVGQIARKLEHFSGAPVWPDGEPGSERMAFRLESADEPTQTGHAEAAAARRPRPSLPDPRLVRRIIRQRQLRDRFFEGELFADPAWDMLLDLTAARAEHVRVSVTSLCIASGVPPTTALRWIGVMTDAGLLQRANDQDDRRRAFVTLSDRAADAMARYFAELAPTPSAPF